MSAKEPGPEPRLFLSDRKGNTAGSHEVLAIFDGDVAGAVEEIVGDNVKGRHRVFVNTVVAVIVGGQLVLARRNVDSDAVHAFFKRAVRLDIQNHICGHDKRAPAGFEVLAIGNRCEPCVLEKLILDNVALV